MERKAESFDYSANAYMSDNSRIPRRVAIAQSSSVRHCRRRLLKLAFYCFAVCLLVLLYKYFVVGASAEEQSGGGEKRYLQIGVEKQPEECRVKSKKRGINYALVTGMEVVDMSGCGVSKGCVLSPADCDPSAGDCDVGATFRAISEDDGGTANTHVEFEVFARARRGDSAWGQYVAIGFSDDQRMGEDAVSACAVAWSGAGSDVRLRYNTGRSNGPALDDAALAPQVVQMLEAGVTGEYVVCRFRQVAKPPAAVDASFVAQLDRQQILLLASGGAVQDDMYQHSTTPFVGGSVNVFQAFVFQARFPSERFPRAAAGGISPETKRTLMKIHGILMILGWMVLLPNGILFARYFEAMWPQHKPFGLFIWFHLHRILNTLGVLLVVVATALIWIAQEWNWVGPQFDGTDWTSGQWHSLLGSLVVVLGLAQPFIALCRCHPGTPNRPIFNWLHRIIGLGAFAISASVIFLSTWVGGAPWPESRGWPRGVVIFYWAVLLCVAIGLETLLALAERAAAATAAAAASSMFFVIITDGSYRCEVNMPELRPELRTEDACPKGEEAVSACAVAWSGASSDVRLRYNTGRSNGPALDDATLVPQVVQMLEAGVTGEYVVCRFRQVAKPPTAVDAAFVAQLDRQQILLLASGGAVQDGILMILGWMVLLPNGILFARYFEAMWPQHKPFGLFIWFHLHRSLNALGVLLVVVAAALIWIAQEWTWDGPQLDGTDWTSGQWHSILGSLVVVLGLAQPFIALCRCHPGTPNRPIFNWIHRIIGLGAFAISASVIFLSTWIGGAPWPESRGWPKGLIAFYWGILFAVAVGLEIQLALAERAAAATAASPIAFATDREVPMRRLGNSYDVNKPDRQLEPQTQDADCPKWGCVRVALLSVFVTLAVGVFIALALLLAID